MSYTGDLRNQLQPLSQALDTIDASPIFAEAALQYDAILLNWNATPRLTRWRVDLQRFYRKQFIAATDHLDWVGRWNLLTLCFAFKTRDKVLAFLDNLLEAQGSAAADWVRPVKLTVLKSGRDTMFPDGVVFPVAASKEIPRAPIPESLDDDDVLEHLPETFPTPSPSSSPPASTSASVSKEPEPALFTIPTLPLAFPTEFFLAWASHIPTSRITLANLLAQPAVYGLGLGLKLKLMLRFNPPAFWAQDTAVWTECHDTLVRFLGKGKLVWLGARAGELTIGDLEEWVERAIAFREGDDDDEDDAASLGESGESDSSGAGSGRGKRRCDDEDDGKFVKRVRFAECGVEVRVLEEEEADSESGSSGSEYEESSEEEAWDDPAFLELPELSSGSEYDDSDEEESGSEYAD